MTCSQVSYNKLYTISSRKVAESKLLVKIITQLLDDSLGGEFYWGIFVKAD